MKIVDKISVAELAEMAAQMYGNLVKVDVDIAKKILIVDMELHSDGEAELIQSGSKQADLWGVNLYPEAFGTDEFIEFDSMINIKPLTNPSRNVQDESIRQQIKIIVDEVVHE